MKTFTATELRLESPKVLNAVQDSGAVIIAHRDRDLMILMTCKEMDRIRATLIEEGKARA